MKFRRVSCFIFLVILSVNCICQEDDKNVKEIICPCLVEYSFPQHLYDEGYCHTILAIPVLRFSRAEVSDNKLICVYEREFAHLSERCGEEFYLYIMGYWGDSHKHFPKEIKFAINDPHSFFTSWNKEGEVVSTMLGLCDLAFESCISDPEWIYTWRGAKYNRRITESSNPNLSRIFDGVAKVNDAGNGFLVANSIQELYGTEGAKIETKKQLFNKEEKTYSPGKIEKTKPAASLPKTNYRIKPADSLRIKKIQKIDKGKK
jgi:hypothetical protein